MKKLLLATGLSVLLIPLTQAQQNNDKSKLCPKIDKIKINLTTPWHYVLSAHNAEGKYFVSDEQQYDDGNWPAPILYLVTSHYEPTEKKLFCVYYAYHRYNIHPTLVNTGDY